MFDFDVGKLLIFGIVALAVIPPKDLPRVMRTVGQALGKMRRMATEFQGQFKEAMREADFESVKKELDGLKDGVTKEVESLEQSAKFDAPKFDAPKIDASFDPAMAVHSELSHAIEPPKAVGLSEVSLTAPSPAMPDPEPVAVSAPSSEPAPANAAAPRDAAE